MPARGRGVEVKPAETRPCSGLGRGRGRGRVNPEIYVAPCDKPGCEFCENNRKGPAPTLMEIFEKSTPTRETLEKDEESKDITEKNQEAKEITEQNQETKEITEKSKPLLEGHQFQNIPSIPHDSETVLMPEDVKFHQEDFFGYNLPPEIIRVTEPVLPTRIIEKDGRYFIETVGKGEAQISEDFSYKITILCVDEDDIVHARFYENPQEKKFGKWTVQNLLKEMDEFYTLSDNKRQTRYGSGGWTPQLNEVVVVRVFRKYYTMNSEVHYVTKKYYHRARVVDTLKDGVTVELLDDYGTGGIFHDSIFKISRRWTSYLPQVFRCELADIDFMKCRKVVHMALRQFPIPTLARNPLENIFEMEFTGELSPENRPCVDISWRTLEGRKYLKPYILDNLSSIINPFHNLHQGSTTCVVKTCDSKGNLWIQFRSDIELLESISRVFNNICPEYDRYAQCARLNLEQILNDEHKNENVKKMYVALINDPEDQTDKLHRVKIIGFNRETNSVTVRSIDYGLVNDIESTRILPISTILPDLEHIPPLLLKVHLNHIKTLDADNEVVKDFILNKETRVALVYEWPSEFPRLPPEISLHPLKFDERYSKNEVSQQLIGFSRLLVEYKAATIYEPVIKDAYSLISKIINEQREKDLDTKLDRGEAVTFAGDNFIFGWFPESKSKSQEIGPRQCVP